MLGTSGKQLVGDRHHTVTIGLDEPDAGAAVDDVVDRERPFVRHRVLEFRTGDVDSIGYRLDGSIAAGGRDHVRRLGAITRNE